MRYLILDLAISRSECMKYYQGRALKIAARARDGRMVHLPAAIMRKYINMSGLQGTFAIYYNDDGQLLQIDKLS